MSAELLNVSGLSYRRNKKSPYSFENINLTVKKTEKVAIYGGIATGKTTFLEVITGLKRQSVGEVELVDDFAVVTEKFNLYADLTVRENLEFTCEINNFSKDKIDEILKSTNLIAWEATYVEKLPQALKKMLQLACAISRDYELLILDAVTVGLDENLTEQLWQLLNKLSSEGKGILLFTPLARDLQYTTKVVSLNKVAQEVKVEQKMTETIPKIELAAMRE